MEIFITVISALVIFIISQFFLEFVLKPLKRYKEATFTIDSRLKFYAHKLNSSIVPSNFEETLKIIHIIRNLSCELEASYKQIFGRNFFVKIHLIPSKGKIGDAASRLIRISNSVGIRNPGEEGNYEDAKEIRKLLGIEALVD
jgi:hypothetical protein